MKMFSIKIALVAFLLNALLFVLAKEWLFFLQNDYQTVLETYLQKHPNIYRHQFFAKEYFTFKTYQAAKIWLGGAVGVVAILQILFWGFLRVIRRHFYEAVTEIRRIYRLFFNDLHKLTIQEKILLLIAVIMILIHQAYVYRTMPGGVDESFSYLFFSSQGIGVTLTHYPAPNNHVFYNLISNFWNWVISDAILAVRATPFLSFWLMEVVLFAFLLRKNNFTTAYFTVLFAGLGFSQSMFSVHGRGYMVCAFFAVLAFLSFLMYLQKNHSLYLWLWGVACILGFWTLPTFLYIMLAFCVFLLWRLWRRKISWKEFFNFLIASFLIMAGVYLAYVGILTYSGLKALIANSDIDRNYEVSWFFSYYLPIILRESIWYIVGLPKYVSFTFFALIFITATWIIWYKRKDKIYQYVWQLLVIATIVTVATIIVMRVSPFYRAWTYYAIFFAWASGYVVGYILPKTVFWKVFSISALFFIGSFFQFEEQVMNAYEPKSHVLHQETIRHTRELIKYERIYISEEAFFVRFWLEYWGKKNALKYAPCRADVAVTTCNEGLPACQQIFRQVWFFNFYENSEVTFP